MRRIFSAHEHLGYGKLSFSNGTAAIYDASPETLKADLRLLRQETGCADFRCLLYPQIPYKRYSADGEYPDAETVNEDFSRLLEELRGELVCYPFLFLRCTDPAERNETLVRRYRDGIYGIKLHPDAELADKRTVERSGVLELAADFGLPVTVHCSRPGGVLDYPAIREVFFPAAAKYGLRINVAHMGFFAPSLFADRLPEGVFTDISPLGIIRDQYRLSGGNDRDFAEKFNRFLAENAGAVMYGGDFPYHRQTWEDGSVHGNARLSGLEFLETLLSDLGPEQRDALFYRNTAAFLGSEGGE